MDELFTSILNNIEVNLWLKLKATTTTSERKMITDESIARMQDININIVHTFFIEDQITIDPSKLSILRAIKIIAPASLEEIVKKINPQNSPEITEKWTESKLDSFRKKQLILRNKNKKYVLTSEGLSYLPVSRFSSSPDIDRILRINRMDKWS